MVQVPLKVELVACYIPFLVKHIDQAAVLLLSVLKVRTAGSKATKPIVVAMHGPLGEAEPAELELALLADHPIAAGRLLDVSLTVGTRLGVCLDPRQVVFVGLLFLLPHDDLRAVGRLVVLIATSDAKGLPALADYRVIVVKLAQLNQLVAALLRTPLDPVV